MAELEGLNMQPRYHHQGHVYTAPHGMGPVRVPQHNSDRELRDVTPSIQDQITEAVDAAMQNFLQDFGHVLRPKIHHRSQQWRSHNTGRMDRLHEEDDDEVVEQMFRISVQPATTSARAERGGRSGIMQEIFPISSVRSRFDDVPDQMEEQPSFQALPDVEQHQMTSATLSSCFSDQAASN